MAFTHGKNSLLYVDQYDLSSYFNDFTMAAKAGTAETTVYGKGAKTFIGGLKEGQISSKGYFDSGATANDQELAGALGRSSNMAVSMAPAGSWTPGSRVIVSSSALTDYQITAPVTGVVAVSFSAQSDSGLSTGVSFCDPTVNLPKSATATDAATTVAAGSNTVNTNTFTGAGTLNVASAAGFFSKGTVVVDTGTTPAFITYTGTTGTTLTGCTTVTGGGVLSTGGNVYQALQDVAAGTTSGVVALLHIPTLTGSSPSFTAKIQTATVSGGNVGSWTDAATFTGPFTTTGAAIAFVAYGTTVNRFLRLVIDSSASTSLTTFNALVTVARQ